MVLALFLQIHACPAAAFGDVISEVNLVNITI